MEELMRELVQYLDPRVDPAWVEILIRKYGNRQFDRGREVGEQGRTNV